MKSLTGEEAEKKINEGEWKCYYASYPKDMIVDKFKEEIGEKPDFFCEFGRYYWLGPVC